MPASLMVLALFLSGCPGPNPTPPGLKIVSLSAMSAAPLTLLGLKVQNLDATATHSVLFSDQDSFFWDAPVVGIEGDTLLVGVPVYVNQQTGLWRPGTVTLTLSEAGPGGLKFSPDFAGLQIESPPTPVVPSGQLTLSFLLGLRDYAEELRGRLVVEAPAEAEQAQALADLGAALARLADAVQDVVGGNTTEFDFGHFNGDLLTLTLPALAQTDRLVLALLDAAAAVEGIPDETVRVASVDGAADFADGASTPCAGLAASELQPTLNDFIEANMRGERPTSQRYLSSIVECAPTAAVTALEVVGASGGIAITGAGALGATAAELALPSLALFSAKASVTAWLIGVGHHLRGIADGTAKAALEEGSKIVEEALQSQVNALRKAFQPDPEPSDEAKEYANELFEHGCTLVKNLKGWTCPKIEDFITTSPTTPTTSSTPTGTTETTSPTTATTPTTASPVSEAFTGTYSGDWGSLSALNGCTWHVTFSGTLRLSLKTTSGTVDGTGTTSVTVYYTVTNEPSDQTCTDSPLSYTATGTVAGTSSSMSGTFSSPDTRPYTLTFQGSRGGNSIGGTGTASRELSTTSTQGDTPPERHSDDVAITLTKD